jgi:hypothetical protein
MKIWCKFTRMWHYWCQFYSTVKQSTTENFQSTLIDLRLSSNRKTSIFSSVYLRLSSNDMPILLPCALIMLRAPCLLAVNVNWRYPSGDNWSFPPGPMSIDDTPIGINDHRRICIC